MWMPLSSHCTNLSSQITEREKISTSGCLFWRFIALGPYLRPTEAHVVSTGSLRQRNKWCFPLERRFLPTSGPFLEKPGNFAGPNANFKIKTCWIVAQFRAHKPVKIASFTDSFIVVFSLKLWSWVQTQQTQNSFPGRKNYQDFQENRPQFIISVGQTSKVVGHTLYKISLSIILTFSFIVFANAKFLLARSIIGYFQATWHLTINC